MAVSSLRKVSKVFGNPDNAADQVPGMNDVSLEVHAGKFFTMIGPSDYGKSPRLRIIARFFPATMSHLTNNLTYT